MKVTVGEGRTKVGSGVAVGRGVAVRVGAGGAAVDMRVGGRVIVGAAPAVPVVGEASGVSVSVGTTTATNVGVGTCAVSPITLMPSTTNKRNPAETQMMVKPKTAKRTHR